MLWAKEEGKLSYDKWLGSREGFSSWKDELLSGNNASKTSRLFASLLGQSKVYVREKMRRG